MGCSGGNSWLLGVLPGYIPQGHTHLGGVGGHSWLLVMLPGDIPQGHTYGNCVGGIPGCWICCRATYLRGTLIGVVWGNIPGCWLCCLSIFISGAFSLGCRGGTFLAAGYAACQHTSGAHSFGRCGGHSWLLDMLPGNIPQGHTYFGGVRDIPGC